MASFATAHQRRVYMPLSSITTWELAKMQVLFKQMDKSGVLWLSVEEWEALDMIQLGRHWNAIEGAKDSPPAKTGVGTDSEVLGAPAADRKQQLRSRYIKTLR